MYNQLGDGYVFDQINSETPISVFIEEDSIVGILKNEQYMKIFQGLQGDKKIITQALQKIQQKQDSIYYMKQVKEQHKITSPMRSEIKNVLQELTPKQIEECQDFQQFVQNMPTQNQEANKGSNNIQTDSPNVKGTRTNSNFEINLQKEVKNLLKKQYSYKFGGNQAGDSSAQQSKDIFQSISSTSSPKQYQTIEESPFARIQDIPLRNKSDSLRGNFMELINNQKQEIEKQSLVILPQRSQGNSLKNHLNPGFNILKNQINIEKNEQLLNGNKKQQYGLINLKRIQSAQQNKESPQKQVNFNIAQDNIDNDDDEYVRELDLLISKELSANNQNKQQDSSQINRSKSLEGNHRKSSSSCHQKPTNNQLQLLQAIKQSEKQGKNDTDPIKCYTNRSGSQGDIYQQRIASDGTNLRGKMKQHQQQNSLFSQSQNKQGKEISNKINIFAFNCENDSHKELDQISQEAAKQDSEGLNIQLGSSESKQSSVGQSKKEEIKNMYPLIFQKARLVQNQQQQQQIQNQTYKKKNGVDIESAEDNLQQKYLLQSSSPYNQCKQPNFQKQSDFKSLKNSMQTDKITGVQEQQSHFLNIDQMSTLQSSQEALSIKASLQAGGSPFQKIANNSSALKEVVQANQSFANTISSGWNKFTISPNLLEKRKSYAENVRNQHKKLIGRTHSQPSIHYSNNVSPVSSIKNSPNSSTKNIRNNALQQRLSFTAALQHQQHQQQQSNNIQKNGNNKSLNNSQSSLFEIPVDQYKKNITNFQNNNHQSSIEQSNKINFQRCSSSLGFQSPQQNRVGRPQSSGFKGKKIQNSSKYSFISAFPNGVTNSQTQLAEMRRQAPSSNIVNQYRNVVDQGNQEISYQANDSMIISTSKEGILQIIPLSQNSNGTGVQDNINNFHIISDKKRQSSAGQSNGIQSNQIKQLGLELNKQVQNQKIQKAIVYSRLQSAKQSNNSLNSNQQQTTQSQIQKDLLKSKANSKIVKGSLVTKLTPEQSSLISSFQNSQTQNSDKKSSRGNQLQENSIRQEILTSLQRKIDIKQTSFIKLQSCQQNKQQPGNNQIEDQNEDIFHDKIIKLQQVSSNPEFKIAYQKQFSVNSIEYQQNQKNNSGVKEDQSGKLSNQYANIQQYEHEQEDEEEEEINCEQLKDEYFLLKLIQERETNSPENYIGFTSEHSIKDKKSNNQNDYSLPNFGFVKSNSSHFSQDQFTMGNNSFGTCEYAIRDDEIEEDNSNKFGGQFLRNSLNKQKQISNTDGGIRHKSILKKTQPQILSQALDNLELQEQVTLGQHSNQDFFNISSDNQYNQHFQNNSYSNLIQKQNEIEGLNTQTFQKRKNSQKLGNRGDFGKQVNISETPKFTFQII